MNERIDEPDQSEVERAWNERRSEGHLDFDRRMVLARGLEIANPAEESHLQNCASCRRGVRSFIELFSPMSIELAPIVARFECDFGCATSAAAGPGVGFEAWNKYDRNGVSGYLRIVRNLDVLEFTFEGQGTPLGESVIIVEVRGLLRILVPMLDSDSGWYAAKINAKPLDVDQWQGSHEAVVRMLPLSEVRSYHQRILDISIRESEKPLSIARFLAEWLGRMAPDDSDENGPTFVCAALKSFLADQV